MWENSGMRFVQFIRSYNTRLGTVLLAHGLSAVVAIWEHAAGRSIAGYAAWGVFVVFMYIAAYMMIRERDSGSV